MNTLDLTWLHYPLFVPGPYPGRTWTTDLLPISQAKGSKWVVNR
jgi:hypothetical protein